MTLQWTRLIFRNLVRRNFHTTKCTSLFYEPPDKDGYRKPSEEELDFEELTWFQKAKLEMALYKEAVKEHFHEWKDNFGVGPEFIFPEHNVQMIHRFNGDKDEMKKWVVTCDSDHDEGHSSAKLEYTRNNKALFHGFLDTKVPVSGRITAAGFCNMKLAQKRTPFKNRTSYEFGPYTHVVCRLRGDGRVYMLNLHITNLFDVDMYDTYHYFIWTRGGPYWEYIKIPFSMFVFAYKGRIQVTHTPVPRDHIGAVSITIADKITGPFKLEIDYIGVEFDPSNTEDTAYETYSFGDHKFW